jgi:hypothetical protein
MLLLSMVVTMMILAIEVFTVCSEEQWTVYILMFAAAGMGMLLFTGQPEKAMPHVSSASLL